MLSYNDLQKGVGFILDGDPYEILESNFVRMQQRKPVMQAKIRNLISGKVVSKTFHQSDSFVEAELQKQEALFVYSHRNEYVFRHPADAKERFSLSEDVVGEQGKFLKEGILVTIYSFKEKHINISLPIKIEYRVKEAPPGIKGDTATGGTKTITLENGLKINVPMFINEGDIIRVNTGTGEYAERVEKK